MSSDLSANIRNSIFHMAVKTKRCSPRPETHDYRPHQACSDLDYLISQLPRCSTALTRLIGWPAHFQRSSHHPSIMVFLIQSSYVRFVQGSLLVRSTKLRSISGGEMHRILFYGNKPSGKLENQCSTFHSQSIFKLGHLFRWPAF